MIIKYIWWKPEKNNLVLHNVNNQDLFNLLEILLSRSGRTDGKKEKQ